MPQINNFPGGFAAGITIRGLPIAVTHPGKVFWVGNATASISDRQIGASDGNPGTFDKPFSTLTKAISFCVANRGDVIMVKPGHAETISVAAGLALNKAGIAIIGLGVGSKRPTLTWSAAASTVSVVASNMSITNFKFVSTMATGFTTVAFKETNATVANDFMVDNCEFADSSSTTGFLSHYLGGTTANQSDGLTWTNNKIYRTLATVTNVVASVVLSAAVARVNFSDNFIVQKTANNNVALGVDFGANAVQNLQMFRNKTHSPNTGTTAGELMSGGSTTSSGLLADNYSWHLAATGLIAPVSTKLAFVQNFCSITGAADKSALINPVAV